jgi:hypothetical protein
VLVTNNDSKQIGLNFIARDELTGPLGIPPLEYGYSAGEFFWMALPDPGRTSYLVVNDTGKVCVCSQPGAGTRLKPTATQRLFALLPAPPPIVSTVDVLLAGFPEPAWRCFSHGARGTRSKTERENPRPSCSACQEGAS